MTSCGPGRPRRTSRARPSASASASRRTSRCAGSRRRGCWRRSTTRPAAGRPPRCGCCRRRRCRSSPAASPHGQGHETAWSMIVAEKMGISPDDVDVLHSDTAIAPLGLDTYGSRSLAGRRRRDRDGLRQGHRQGQADRRPPARSVGRRPRVRGRRVLGAGLARQGDAAGGDRLRGVHGPQPA